MKNHYPLPGAAEHVSQPGLPPRVLLDVGDPMEGPTLVVFAGIHGNERSGLESVRRLNRAIDHDQIAVRGRILAVSGNRKAIACNQRFIDRDLNRRWGRTSSSPALGVVSAEDEEQRELVEVLEDARRASPTEEAGGVVLLDLHSTSGKTPAFCCLADAPGNHRLAFALGLPVIFGLEETADGTLLGHYNDLGVPGLAVEGGQHEDPRTIERQVAAIWVLLASIGILDPGLTHVKSATQALAAATKGRPQAVEIVYRHPVHEQDEFKMVSGFASFQRVTQGTVLAHDRRGPVLAPMDGRILLPLYQGEGEDGFFLASDMTAAKLSFLHILRQLRVDRALKLLPGVHTVDGEDAFKVTDSPLRGVNRRVLGLFGYRREGEDNVISRRRQLQ